MKDNFCVEGAVRGAATHRPFDMFLRERPWGCGSSIQKMSGRESTRGTFVYGRGAPART